MTILSIIAPRLVWYPSDCLRGQVGWFWSQKLIQKFRTNIFDFNAAAVANDEDGDDGDDDDHSGGGSI